MAICADSPSKCLCLIIQMFVLGMRRARLIGLPVALSLSTIQRAQCSAANSTDITLFQYKICPFCHRVKAYLDFNGIAYKTVEVNPLTKVSHIIV